MTNAPEPIDGYRVTRIDSLKGVYLIYARKNKTTFKIVPNKVAVTNCKSITTGHSYKFDLRSLYFTDLTPDERMKYAPLATTGNLGSEGIDWDGEGTIIKLEGDSITDIFYAKNVTGLCFR
jgi:hypothetical protein